MDLSSTFLGISVKSPVIVGSSGLTSNMDNLIKCEKAGAGAVVLKSLFEEQLIADKSKLLAQDDTYFWYPEAVDFIDSVSKEHGTDAYLDFITEAKKKVSIPVIASINCISPREWPVFTKKIEDAGADGLELNIFIPPTDIKYTGYKREETYLEIINAVRQHVEMPLGVKISYFFSNLTRAIFKLSTADIQGLVLFNRYYRPDIDIEKMQVVSKNILSSKEEITLSLRWVTLMANKIQCELIASTGIHDAEGVIKQILAGATSVEICSTLYKNKTSYISTINKEIEDWMKKKGFSSLEGFRGKIVNDQEMRTAFERIQFIQKTTGKL